MVVQNPKDIITHGLPNLPSLRDDMARSLLEIAAGFWVGGDPRDAALAYAPPVFMLEQAVNSMARAKALGEEEEKREEEEERKRKIGLILLILGVAFLFVPIVGEEVAATLGFVNLGRIIALAGELGNGALGVYDPVNDPSSAVVNMLGMLFGLGAIAKAGRDAKGLGEVAAWRKNMKPEEVASLGRVFQGGDQALQTVLGKVCKL